MEKAVLKTPVRSCISRRVHCYHTYIHTRPGCVRKRFPVCRGRHNGSATQANRQVVETSRHNNPITASESLACGVFRVRRTRRVYSVGSRQGRVARHAHSVGRERHAGGGRGGGGASGGGGGAGKRHHWKRSPRVVRTGNR